MLVEKVDEIAKNSFQDSNIHRRLLVPDLFDNPKDFPIYPFKMNTLMICLERSLSRKEHLTMKHGPVHSLLSFVNCLRTQLKDDFDKKFPHHSYIRVLVPYFDRQVVENGLKEPKNAEAIGKLEQLLKDMMSGARKEADACPEVLSNLAILAPLNHFANLDEPTVTGICNNILAIKK